MDYNGEKKKETELKVKVILQYKNIVYIYAILRNKDGNCIWSIIQYKI